MMIGLIVAATVAAGSVTNDSATIVVEASRLDRTTMEMPMAVQVIGAEALSGTGAGDVTEVLKRRCPQLTVSSMYGTNPAGANIAFAGYGENGGGRALVIVDGERLNGADMSMINLSRIDMGSVQSIEILSGPQSVLHGDMASGGVINIVTDSPDYDDHGHAQVRVGSWNTVGMSAGYRSGIADEGVRYWSNVGWDRSDGYRENSAYDLWNANGGVKWESERGSYLRSSAFYSRSDYELPRGLPRERWRDSPRHSVQRDAKYAEERVDDFRQQAQGMNVTGYGVIDDENALRITVTASRTRTKSQMFGGGYDDYARADYVWESRMDYDAYAFRGKAEYLRRGELARMEDEFVAGIGFGYDRIEKEGVSPTYYHPAYPAERYIVRASSAELMDRQSMAFFGEETLYLTDSWKVSAGLRYEREWNRCTAAAVPRDIDDVFAYDFAIGYLPTEELKLYLRFSRFFRNAYLDELSYRGGYDPIATPDPETGYRVEAGTEWIIADEVTLSADVYLSETEHEIFYNPFFIAGAYGWSGDNVNSPHPVRRSGLDFAAAWEREQVAGVAAAVSVTETGFRGGKFDGNQVPMVPSVALSVTGRIWIGDEAYLFGGMRYRSAVYTISDFEHEYSRMPAFTVFHLGVAYEPTFATWVKGWRASLTVDNLFDRIYCEYGAYGATYYPAAGRSIMLAIRYEF